MGDVSARADRFVRKVFAAPPVPPTVQAKEIQTRAEKLVTIAQRAVLRRKGM